MMKVLVCAVLALGVFASTASADVGSTFGSLTTARAMGKGQLNLGGRLGLADNTSFVGTFGYGLSNTGDARIKVGLIDDEFIETELTLGADVKWQVWDMNSIAAPGKKNKAFDLAFGGFVEWFSVNPQFPVILFESQTVFQVGAQAIGSYPITLSNGDLLTPYGRVNVRNESINVDLAPGVPLTADISDSHMAIGINGGVAWQATPRMTLFGEFQIDGNDGLFLGLEYGL